MPTLQEQHDLIHQLLILFLGLQIRAWRITKPYMIQQARAIVAPFT